MYVLSSVIQGAKLNTDENVACKLALIMCCLFVLSVLNGVFEKGKLKRKNEIFEYMLKKEREQYKISKENIDIINHKCHDMKHQIAALRNIGDDKKRNEYLRQLEQSVMIYNAIAKTGNEGLDVIFSEKSLLCEKYNINFTYMVDGKQFAFMDIMDIYILFGNMVDNAIESVAKIADEEKRIISFWAATKGKILKIHMENYYEDALVFHNGLPLTTKNDKTMHGFGMKSMEHVVDKYGGSMTIDTDNNVFSINIVFTLS